MLIWEFMERGNQRAAGMSLGVAIVLKLVPGVLLIWLLVRGWHRAAAWGLATTVILALALPMIALRWPETVRAHREFARIALVEHSAVEHSRLGSLADFGMWCCLMLLLSPLVSTHYLVFMMIPLIPPVLLLRAPSSVGGTPKARRAAAAGLAWWMLGLVALLSPTARAMGASWLALAGLWATNLAIVRECLYKPARPIAA